MIPISPLIRRNPISHSFRARILVVALMFVYVCVCVNVRVYVVARTRVFLPELYNTYVCVCVCVYRECEEKVEGFLRARRDSYTPAPRYFVPSRRDTCPPHSLLPIPRRRRRRHRH